MGFRLIPVRHAGHIVLPLEQPSMTNSDLLDRDLQILFEQNRIHDVPTVKTAFGQMVVRMIVVVNRRIAAGIPGISQKRRAIGIFYRPPVFLGSEAPGPSEIILRTGAADGGICLIPVQIKFHFPFPVPVPLQGGDLQTGPHILSPALYAV